MKILSGIRYNTLILFILFIVCAVFAILFPTEESAFYKANYTTLLGGLIVCSLILSIKLKDRHLFLFDPFLFASILSFCIFFIQPMIDILEGRVIYYGWVYPAYGCQKATIVFVVSYLAFACGYFLLKGNANCSLSIYQSLTENQQNKISFLSLFLWIVFTSCCIAFFLFNGYSLRYIFSLGQLGNIQIDEIFSRAGFLWKFSGSMIVCLLYYLCFGNNKILKLIMFLISMSIMLLNGGRAGLLVLFLAPLVYYYAKKGKNPPLQHIVIFGLSFLILSAVVQTARWSLRSGGSVQRQMQWTIEAIIEPMRSNFRVYNLYYLIVDAMPDKIDYFKGKETLLYTGIMFIPRSLWPNKPDAPFREIVRYVVGDLAVMNGEAFPGLTEPYIDFGWIGCLIYSFIVGCLIAKLRNLYVYSRGDTHGLILYSIFYADIFQAIIRGYIPSFFYSILCILFPYFILKLLVPVSQRKTVKYRENK